MEQEKVDLSVLLGLLIEQHGGELFINQEIIENFNGYGKTLIMDPVPERNGWTIKLEDVAPREEDNV